MARAPFIWIGAGLGAATLGGAVLAVGPLAAPLVDAVADGRKVWRLGVARVDGVRGAWLGDLRAETVTLRDPAGEWAVARDVRLGWAPFALFSGRLAIDAVEIGALDIARRPNLSAPPPPSRTRVATTIAALRAKRIALAEGVAGEAAAFTLSARLDASPTGLNALTLDLARTDGGADRLTAAYDAKPLRLDARLDGPAGGVFASLVGAPITAEARGGAGEANVAVTAADAPLLDARLSWTAQTWKASGEARLAAAPALAGLAERFGGDLRLVAEGDAPGAKTPARATLEAPRMRLALQGPVDARLRPAGPLAVDLRLDGRAINLSGGALTARGEAEVGARTTFKGALRLDDLDIGLVQGRGSGPLTARLDAEALRFEARLDKFTPTSGDATARRLLDRAVITAKGDYDRDRGRLTLGAIEARSPRAHAHGAGAWTGARGGLAGRWTVSDLSAVILGWAGRASGTWDLDNAGGGAGQRLRAQGRGAQVKAGGPEPLAQLIGRTPTLGADLTFRGGGVAISSATLAGPGLRAGVRGPVRAGRMDLAVEASARGPARIGGADVRGVADVTGRLQGPAGAPTFTGQARLDRLDIAGAILSTARIDIVSAPQAGGARSGRLGVSGLLQDRPLRLEGALSTSAKGARWDDLSGAWAGLALSGAASAGTAGPVLDLTASGPIAGLAAGVGGRLEATLAARPGPDGGPLLALRGEMRGVALGPQARLETATIVADGPLDAIRTAITADGALAPAAPFSLRGTGQARLDDGIAWRGGLEGRLAQEQITTRVPLDMRLDGPDWRLGGAVRIGAGDVQVEASGAASRFTAELDVSDAPLTLLTAWIGEPVDGRASGTVTARAQGAALTGGLDLDVKGLRLARRARENVDGTLRARLEGGRLSGDATFASAAGLKASLQGGVDVIASAAPLRIARAPGGAVSGAWRVEGPIGAAWAALGPLDQALEGRLSGAGDLRLAGGRLRGSGGLSIEGGRFEDRASGLRLEAVSATLAFDDDGVSLERFAATDGQRGRMSGSGRLDGAASARLRLTLADMRLLNHPDAKARGDAELDVSWTQAGATLSGAVRLREASVRPPRTNGAALPQIAVVEINRPPTEEAPARPGGPMGAGPPLRFNVAISAPGRIFTRGRGLEAEWSMDARLEGTAARPLLFGRADLVRGQFTLAGRRFDLDRGRVAFAGAPNEAEVDIAASVSTPDLEAQVSIAGPAETPEVRFSATPPLPEDEILPQVLFGRSADELSPLEAAQLAASLAAMSGQAAFALAAAARAAVNLDRLDLRQDGDGVLVTGGKYLSREVYLEVARDSLGRTATRLEWEVRPRLILVSSFLPNGDQRVAVRWRRQY